MICTMEKFQPSEESCVCRMQTQLEIIIKRMKQSRTVVPRFYIHMCNHLRIYDMKGEAKLSKGAKRTEEGKSVRQE